MAQEQSIKRDVFGVVFTPAKPLGPGKRTIMDVVGSDYDKETGTFSPIFEEVDLFEEIQKCKALAGLDAMRALLAQGKAKVSDFYDDGAHGVDVAAIPADVHQAIKTAEEGNQALAQLAKAIGVDEGEALTAAQLEKALTQFVAKQYAAQQAAAAAAASEGEVKKDE